MKITKSDGKSRNGAVVYFVRPDVECFNRSYRISCLTEEAYVRKISRIAKKITPEILWLVDGHKIVASNKEQALKEYWRVCDESKTGNEFEVILYPT